MPPGVLDSNVLIYAVTDDPRAAVAQALLEAGCAISVQGLNEFANVARRKFGKSWAEISAHLATIRTLCALVVVIDTDVHGAALHLAERYDFAFYDALMVAAALQAGSETLWSEDTHDGLLVEGRLRIANPFRPSLW